MKVKGTVEFRDLEGGIYELHGDDGKKYALSGSKSDLKAARGAKVEVEGSLDDGFGIGMTGPQLKVSKVRKI
jgi:formylmethanofuran dehydrogenase subunit C